VHENEGRDQSRAPHLRKHIHVDSDTSAGTIVSTKRDRSAIAMKVGFPDKWHQTGRAKAPAPRLAQTL
jgi:hypothetical protein